MTLPDRDGTRDWIGRAVVDRDGADIGVCAALLADTVTGLPEWMYVERDGETLVVPLLEAEESGGRVHVTVTRALVDGAPRIDPAHELSRAQEAALYQHYGIEYSTAASDSLLPADAQPTDDDSTGSAPEPAGRRLLPRGAAQRPRGLGAAVAVLVGLASAVVAAVRLRRGTSVGSQRRPRRGAPPPTPAARRVLTAARTHADGAAARLASLVATTGRVAWHAVRAGTDSTLRVTDAVTEAVTAAVPRVADATVRAGRTGLRAVSTVGAAAEAVPGAVAGTGGRLEKGWRRVMGRLSLALGFGAGYVLGARAGQARYEQIRRAAADLMERPEVQQALEKARTAAPAPLQGTIDKLSGRGSGGQVAGPGTVDAHAVPAGDLDVGGTPPPPVSGTGGPPATDAPLPDPLIPPAKSGDDPTARQ